MPYLFVYGTLRKGVVNEFAAMLSRSAHYIGAARVRGRLYRVAHYPALMPSRRGCGWVRGDVYALDHPVRMFRILDEYEGLTAPSEFQRTTILAKLDSGERIEAWVYVYTRGTVGLPRIVSGDFLNPRPRQAMSRS